MAVEMSDGEALLFLVCLFAPLLLWGHWYFVLFAPKTLGRRREGRRLLAFAPSVALLLVFAVLRTLASADVRGSRFWTTFYVLFAATWIPSVEGAFPLLGLSMRDDVAERGNRAAAVALAGAVLAVALCFAGGNVGDGPGWYVVVFSGGLATAALFAGWAAYAVLTPAVEAITVERDVGAAVRFAALLIALGLLLGRAVAGTWLSADATLHDFALALPPILAVLGFAVVVERWVRSTRRGGAAAAILPASAYLGTAAWLVVRAGWPI